MTTQVHSSSASSTGTTRTSSPLFHSKYKDLDISTRAGRRAFLGIATTLVTGMGTYPTLALANDESSSSSPSSITPCETVSDGPINCVSTRNIKQIDLYMPPWTYPSGMSSQEAMGRLKGALQATDRGITIVEETESTLRVRAPRPRNFATDEILFVFNDTDKVITFRSSQVEGPSVNDFNGNRNRLQEIRKYSKVFGSMGESFDTADSQPREGPLGQLKAFYGLQSGKGYEDVFEE